MKHTKRGFIIPLLIIIVVALSIGGGAYIYKKNDSNLAPTNKVDDNVLINNSDEINSTSTITIESDIKPSASSNKSSLSNATSAPTIAPSQPKTLYSVISPSSDVSLKAGDNLTIKWSSSNKYPYVNVHLITDSDRACDEILMIRTGSCKGYRLYNGNDHGVWDWTVPANIPAGHYLLRVGPDTSVEEKNKLKSAGINFNVFSNAYINILSSDSQIISQSSTFKIISPNGGETFKTATQYNLTFSPGNAAGKNIKIYLINDETGESKEIAGDLAKSGEFQSSLLIFQSNTLTGFKYKIGISICESSPGGYGCYYRQGHYDDISDNYFSITY